MAMEAPQHLPSDQVPIRVVPICDSRSPQPFHQSVRSRPPCTKPPCIAWHGRLGWHRATGAYCLRILRSLLGIGVHGVLERAARSGISGTTEDHRVRKAARHFDEQMKGILQRAHPLVRAKFGSPERIPFYNLYRARATRIAAQMPRTHSGFVVSAAAPGREPSRLAELTLKSRDQRVRGRP